ncbi:UvrD-helicase domain-containing protein [Methylobacterium radiotolerans]|uniref:UvrD-helicase domain-containing protein n=1 Tax=Methylobacterium radiotolerans TaxID=31998 RepID=UPI0024782556|nr:UvrD-helicase domain-containing protein [Methylobacterium radiotolerans]
MFAVGDADQSIYGFTGANPELLEGLTERPDVRTIRLRFNYRSGRQIVRAPLGALGAVRDYRARAGAPQGQHPFRPPPPRRPAAARGGGAGGGGAAPVAPAAGS